MKSPEGDSLYASPAGPYFCSCKSRQNTLGAVPQDPLTLKLRLDTNDALASSVQRRRYALKVPAAHFMWGLLQTNSRKSRCRDYGLDKQLFVQTAPPPQRSKKSSKRASEQREDFFGHRKAEGANTPWLPLERICAQYGFRFFDREKSKSVASAAKRQEGLSRGKPGPP